MLQRPGEFRQLLSLYLQRKPKRVLEIGVEEGGTLYHWLQSSPKVAVAVDLGLVSRPDLAATWHGWVLNGTHLEPVAGASQSEETFQRVEQFAPFDWMFIDADHRYDAVRADWERYRPLCSGVLAFHDILPPSQQHPEIQVSRLWQEIKADGYRTLELIDDPTAAWGGIGVVFLDEEA